MSQDHHPPPPQPQRCPRCDSSETKFCYYNNHSFSQPRYFCKTCRRYWTQGGTLRNVPIGGGCRKEKRFKKSSSCSSSNNNVQIPQFRNQEGVLISNGNMINSSGLFMSSYAAMFGNGSSYGSRSAAALNYLHHHPPLSCIQQQEQEPHEQFGRTEPNGGSSNSIIGGFNSVLDDDRLTGFGAPTSPSFL